MQGDKEQTMNNVSGFDEAHSTLQRLRENFSAVVIGQQRTIDEVLVCLAASGHVLIEGVPGLAKTLLARCLAHSAQARDVRIQFTPDLMPSDIVGHAMFDHEQQTFSVREGPIFANVIVADEINRAPAKTQAALLEAMQEQQVSIEGDTRRLPQPFIVIATQNPIEQEGTYPLPQAQLDRFLCKVLIDYPSAEDELLMLQHVTHERIAHQLDLSELNPVTTLDELSAIQRAASYIPVDESVQRYIVDIISTTRNWNGIDIGAGPRGTIALLRAARGQALLQGNAFVTPNDVKQMAAAVLRHRIQLTPDLDIEGYRPDDVVADVLATVDAPRQ
jgi:MoxR-like ATPase